MVLENYGAFENLAAWKSAASEFPRMVRNDGASINDGAQRLGIFEIP